MSTPLLASSQDYRTTLSSYRISQDGPEQWSARKKWYVAIGYCAAITLVLGGVALNRVAATEFPGYILALAGVLSYGFCLWLGARSARYALMLTVPFVLLEFLSRRESGGLLSLMAVPPNLGGWIVTVTDVSALATIIPLTYFLFAINPASKGKGWRGALSCALVMWSMIAAVVVAAEHNVIELSGAIFNSSFLGLMVWLRKTAGELIAAAVVIHAGIEAYREPPPQTRKFDGELPDRMGDSIGAILAYLRDSLAHVLLQIGYYVRMWAEVAWFYLRAFARDLVNQGWQAVKEDKVFTLLGKTALVVLATIVVSRMALVLGPIAMTRLSDPAWLWAADLPAWWNALKYAGGLVAALFMTGVCAYALTGGGRELAATLATTVAVLFSWVLSTMVLFLIVQVVPTPFLGFHTIGIYTVLATILVLAIAGYHFRSLLKPKPSTPGGGS